MSFRVSVQPGGREFVVERGETLLEAALRAGLNLRYNCNSGTCGECRAHLVRGSLGEPIPHDYAFSEAEKAQGWFLLCRAHAGSDLVIEAPQVRDARTLPVQEIVTRVARLEAIGSYGVLQVRTPRTRTLNFLAGQAADLTIGTHTRRLAIASCPCNGMVLEFHLRFDPDDDFARAAATLATGASVVVRGPHGDFLLDEAAQRPLFMIGEGTGVAPLKSLIEHALALEWPKPIRFWWFAEAGGHYQENYWRALDDAMDDLRYERFAPDEHGCRTLWEERAQFAGCDIYAAVSLRIERELLQAASDVSSARLFLYA